MNYIDAATAIRRRLCDEREDQMPVYKAPVDDTLFLLNDVFDIERYNNLPGFADASADVIEAVLGEGAKLCEEVLQPINHSGDQEGCTRHPDGSVTTPKGFKEAYQAYAGGGWIGLAMDPEYGGQGLPYTLGAVMNEYASAANMAFAMYPGLTMGAIAALYVHGSDEIKRTYLPKMIDGTWSGTMNLTEPHCGTDLGLLKTKAVPNGDGSYAISGTKIFISAGEQDITGNIIHLVLARIEGAPAGVKGISLFVVPRNKLGSDGSVGANNGVSCGSIEHKMGIHGNATCVMNYDGAQGWLVGAENKGLNAMFVMMNEARLGVAIQGLAQSEVAYQNAVAYAKERLQGRALRAVARNDQAPCMRRQRCKRVEKHRPGFAWRQRTDTENHHCSLVRTLRERNLIRSGDGHRDPIAACAIGRNQQIARCRTGHDHRIRTGQCGLFAAIKHLHVPWREAALAAKRMMHQRHDTAAERSDHRLIKRTIGQTIDQNRRSSRQRVQDMQAVGPVRRRRKGKRLRQFHRCKRYALCQGLDDHAPVVAITASLAP